MSRCDWGWRSFCEAARRRVGKLAEATGAEERSLGRLLTALSTIGLCERTSENSYALTEVGACLDGASEQSFKAWAILEAEMLTKSWSGMLESVVTGKTAAQLLGIENSFDLMAQTPGNVAKFNAAMTDLTRAVTPEILRCYDFSGLSHLMDVGGGSGELLGAIAQAKPAAARHCLRPSEVRGGGNQPSSTHRCE